jgi:hypothetical protein
VGEPKNLEPVAAGLIPNDRGIVEPVRNSGGLCASGTTATAAGRSMSALFGASGSSVSGAPADGDIPALLARFAAWMLADLCAIVGLCGTAAGGKVIWPVSSTGAVAADSGAAAGARLGGRYGPELMIGGVFLAR